MENKPTATEITETPEQTAGKVEVTSYSIDTKADKEKTGISKKLFLKVAALMGIGAASVGGGVEVTHALQHEAPATSTSNPETHVTLSPSELDALGPKNPSKDILVNPNLQTQNEVKDPSLDINMNPNLPDSLRVGSIVESHENPGSTEESPSLATITPESATSIPSFPPANGSNSVYSIPLGSERAPAAQPGTTGTAANGNVETGRIGE